ncbi:MAG: dipicolinate synthase subunit B [Clostridia bacterium]|nr:dipicolinate synthase subunit B [Clostridia bacterium]MBR0027709.1 dipicolinate synthase subunit B [Clostridia bacterium]
MELEGKTIGFAMCGSFCTFKRALSAMEALKGAGADIVPIMSGISYSTDTRFGRAEDFVNKIKAITGNEVIHTVKDAEPIGPKNFLDMLIVLPCTGNSLAKLAAGIADTSVTMAVKAHLRNQKPVLIAVSTNDGLGNAAKNIGNLLNYKNIYFVPLTQDDYIQKPTSLVADFTKTVEAAKAALQGRQIEPLLV